MEDYYNRPWEQKTKPQRRCLNSLPLLRYLVILPLCPAWQFFFKLPPAAAAKGAGASPLCSAVHVRTVALQAKHAMQRALAPGSRAALFAFVAKSAAEHTKYICIAKIINAAAIYTNAYSLGISCA